MPPTKQDQTRSRCLGQKSTSRATSVPVGRENSRLESLRSKKQKRSILDIGDAPPSSLPAVVIARGRKRDASSFVTSQIDCAASASLAVSTEQRPRKRPKRAVSTPPAPSQPSAQLRSRRRPRSRVGSPSTDVEYAPLSRISARLSRKTHPFFASLNSDIYRHLADPDSAGKLLGEPSVGPVISFTPDETLESQSVKRPRGRQRRNTDLMDENAKRVLMEEWARMRQSQGILQPPGINGNVCSSQTSPHENQTSDGSIPATRLKVTTWENSPSANRAKSRATTIVDISQSQETILDASLRRASSTQIDPENAYVLREGMDASGIRLDQTDPVMPSTDGTVHLAVPSLDIPVPSIPNFDSRLDEDFLADKPADIPGAAHHGLLQCLGLSVPLVSTSSSQVNSALIKYEKSTRSPHQTDFVSLDSVPKDGHSETTSQMRLYSAGDIHLDSDEEFYMLDALDVFTLPWVSVSSHLYVPPGLAKLISGMREQLMMEARARRRAEELYQAELSRRISAEKTIRDLQTCLEKKHENSCGRSTR